MVLERKLTEVDDELGMIKGVLSLLPKKRLIKHLEHLVNTQLTRFCLESDGFVIRMRPRNRDRDGRMDMATDPTKEGGMGTADQDDDEKESSASWVVRNVLKGMSTMTHVTMDVAAGVSRGNVSQVLSSLTHWDSHDEDDGQAGQGVDGATGIQASDEAELASLGSSGKGRGDLESWVECMSTSWSKTWNAIAKPKPLFHASASAAMIKSRGNGDGQPSSSSASGGTDSRGLVKRESVHRNSPIESQNNEDMGEFW